MRSARAEGAAFLHSALESAAAIFFLPLKRSVSTEATDTASSAAISL
jgi:hypothetical protein